MLTAKPNNLSEPTVTRIEIRYSDGSFSYAEGADAETIMKWWNSCETMQYIHGCTYSGPRLTIVPAEAEKERGED